MANEIAIKLLSEPGDELVAAENCHLFFAEAGGPAVHSGVMLKPIKTKTGIFTDNDVRDSYCWSHGPHHSITKLLSVENTTNLGGGVPWPSPKLSSLLSVAKELQLKIHLDGSRLFNAVVATSIPINKLAAGFDTVTLCFSKGLGCPVGAVLVFDKHHYQKARRLKQLMGGAMRQSGILAAAALYALDHHISRLAEDHENARLLAKKLNEIPQIFVENNPPSTNMVFFNLRDTKITPQLFLEKCIKKGVRFSRVGENRFRAVTHLDIHRDDVKKSIILITDTL